MPIVKYKDCVYNVDMGKKGQVAWNKGKKLSNSHKQSLSDAHKGNTPWNKGLKGVQSHTQEFKDARAESARRNGLGKHERTNGAWNKGKKGIYHWSEEQRIKWTEWSNTEEAQIAFKKQGIKTMQTVSKKETAPERAIAKMLDSLGIVYESQASLADMTIVDFLIPEKKLVIYADGNYWHDYPNGKLKDHIQTKYLMKIGYKVLRFWESDIHSEPFKVLKRIMKACNM